MKIIYSLLLIFSLSLTQFVATAQSQISGSEVKRHRVGYTSNDPEAVPSWANL